MKPLICGLCVFLCACLYTCVYTCVCVPECMPVYVCACQLSAWVLYFLRQGFSLAWNSLIQWDWLTCELQGFQHLVHKQTSSGPCACKANTLLTEPFPWLCFHVFIDTQWSSCLVNLLGLLAETVFLGSQSIWSLLCDYTSQRRPNIPRQRRARRGGWLSICVTSPKQMLLWGCFFLLLFFIFSR